MATVASSVVTCEGAPEQIEGQLDDGRWFYFRARHRSIRLHVSEESADHAATLEPMVDIYWSWSDDPHIWSTLQERDLVLRALVSLLP